MKIENLDIRAAEMRQRMLKEAPTVSRAGNAAVDVDAPMTINQVAEALGIKKDLVIKLFENESGTIIIVHPPARGKSRRRTIRIPTAVFYRVRHRLTSR
jgi:hypothetical protein